MSSDVTFSVSQRVLMGKVLGLLNIWMVSEYIPLPKQFIHAIITLVAHSMLRYKAWLILMYEDHQTIFYMTSHWVKCAQ